MQSQLLDLTIIGCLVLLFASTYRKRATPMVRSWTLGWLLILVHFAALLFHPARPVAHNLLTILSLSSLILCGIVFIFATGHYREAGIALPVIATSASIVFVTFVVCGVTATLPYYITGSIAPICLLIHSTRVRYTSKVLRNLLLLSTLSTGIWLIWSVAHGHADIGISAILTRVYLAVGLIYLGTFRRISAGTLTVVFGLLAWAAVFPTAEFCDHLGLIAHINPEFWNVPKYFVAFGMMLFLLEEEILAAGQAAKHYKLLFEANPHPMWIYDPLTLSFEMVNDAAVAQYGYSREQFHSMNLNDICAGAGGEDLFGPQQHRKSDGSLCSVDVATHQLQSNGRHLSFSLVQDVTDRQQLHQRLVHQANHDLLTSLPNRACLEEKLRETLQHRNSGTHQSALLCLDVDRFKQINDTYGHGVGDICLQEVARRLTQLIGPKDTAARTGGEEFSLLLQQISGRAEAEQVAHCILSTLQTPIQANIFSIELTASIGIALCPTHGSDVSTLWRNADSAMYRAKRAGGNQFLSMSAEISQSASEANEIELHVRRALKEGGLEVHYQPLYTLDGSLHSLEALVRLHHPVYGMVSPTRFVAIAEERGLIVPLSNWVLNEVCRQSCLWQQAGLPPIRIALNISPLEITRPDFAANVSDTLTAHNVDPHLIGMEITETAMMRNLTEASRQINLLAGSGIAFSIDDFGTGYSSLGHLDNLPVQTLTIDRSFIERIGHSGGTFSIVDAIISMAHSLQLSVVAEGVETEAQWSCLRDLNCDAVQGYLFSRPCPAAEISILLQQNRHIHPTLVQHGTHAQTKHARVA